MIKKVTIIDYGAGNLLSIVRAFQKCGADVEITHNSKKIKNSSSLILPGDGAFGFAMNSLKKLEILKEIKDFSKSGNPIFGICLGMQLLFTESEEFGKHNGINLIKGKIIKINQTDKKYKVPIIGWNKVKISNIYFKKKIFNIFNNDIFYFVHSFQVKTYNKNNLLAYYKYNNKNITSVVAKDNILGTQFHPEKSGVNGLKFLSKFLKTY